MEYGCSSPPCIHGVQLPLLKAMAATRVTKVAEAIALMIKVIGNCAQSEKVMFCFAILNEFETVFV